MTLAMDPDRVDWLAVEFVCTGTRMRLSGDPATLSAAILAIGAHLTTEQIAERLGTTMRQVLRVLEKHGAQHCPCCRRSLLMSDGIVPKHVNNHGLLCKMQGYHIGDTARVDQIRADARTVASFR